MNVKVGGWLVIQDQHVAMARRYVSLTLMEKVSPMQNCRTFAVPDCRELGSNIFLSEANT